MTDTHRRPIEGRILGPGEPLPADLKPATPPPPPPPRPEPPEPPPPVTHIHVTLPPGEPIPHPVDTTPRRPLWLTRTAICVAAALAPWPYIGAPAARWAIVLNDVIADQSVGGAWVIAGTAAGIAWLIDRNPDRRRWDRDHGAYRPGWAPRTLLATTTAGAVLALPVFDTAVRLMTGVTP